MKEIWLHANRRAILMAMILTSALAVVGILLLTGSSAGWIRVVGWVLTAVAAALLTGLINQWRHPRISYRDGAVSFNLRAGAPVAVPVEIVEAFFLGQGPAHLPAPSANSARTVNLVARLSQKAPEWAEVEVKPALGNWREGYVSIRGTWCEPLNGELIRRLNRRLREIHQANGAEAAAATSESCEQCP